METQVAHWWITVSGDEPLTSHKVIVQQIACNATHFLSVCYTMRHTQQLYFVAEFRIKSSFTDQIATETSNRLEKIHYRCMQSSTGIASNTSP